MIILASKSPRRIELMQSLGLEFSVEVSEIDESIYYDKDPIKLNQRLSYEKANAVAHKNPNQIVIGADTMVIYENKILGKPKSKEEAREMLTSLSGNTHEVVTSISIIKGKQTINETSISKVSFYEISPNEIEEYLNSNEPYDKAGSYAIQGYFGKKFIKNINGDYFAIMGLPIASVYQILKKIM